VTPAGRHEQKYSPRAASLTARSRQPFIDALGLPLEGEGDGYYSSRNVPGSKHFGVWSLTEAAQARFGTPEWRWPGYSPRAA